MPLNVDYRPARLDEIVGNEANIKSLSSRLKSDDPPRSYFVTGPPGCGKTTIGYVVKEELKISNFDFYEYNSANTKGIDTIRQIISILDRAPMEGNYRLFLLDEFHEVTGPALNAILKTLEDPPKHVIFVLCTSEPDRIKSTPLKAIRRRCFEIEMKALTTGKIIRLLKEILTAEELEEYPDSIITKIADNCWGSPGQALSLLDSVIDMDTEKDALEAIDNLVVSEASVKELIQILLDSRISGPNTWEQIRKLIPKLSGEPETIRYAIAEWINKIMIGKGLDMNLMGIASFFTESFMYTGKLGLTLACAMACQSKRKPNPSSSSSTSTGKEDDIPF